MANLVLYRKYRPKTFSEVVGQEHVVKTLTNAIANDRVSHAYIFSGPRGTGKTTLARLLAKAVNCEQRNGYEPCNKCRSCQEINQGRAVDLIEIDAASNRGIEEIRALRAGIRFSPTMLKYKVFIIDESHQLTAAAANALLKVLEEPPSHAIFVLATTEIHKMLPTIISRCQRFDFRRLTLPEIVKKLNFIVQKEGVKLEKSVLELIALNSQGSARDAEVLLNQALTFAGGDNSIDAEDIKNLLGIVETSSASQFVDFINQSDTSGALNFLSQIFNKGGDPQEFNKALINYLRMGMLLKINPEFRNTQIMGLTQEEQEKLQTQISDISLGQIHNILSLFLKSENDMRYASIKQLPLELAVVKIIDSQTKK